MQRTLYFILIVVFLGAGATLTGCKGSKGSQESKPQQATPATLSPVGRVTKNGLGPDLYWKQQGPLESRLKARLIEGATTTMDGGLLGDLASDFKPILDVKDGKQLVEYAVDCAVAGSFVGRSIMGSVNFSTTGILKGTDQWLSDPDGLLNNLERRKDVHTCIATRLNPYAEVCIWLGGVRVNGDTTDPARYPVDEAFWAAAPGANGEITINVWPSDMLKASCPDGTDMVLSTRVCGTAAGTAICHLDQPKTSCHAEPDLSWSCEYDPDGPTGPSGSSFQRAIQTKMQCEDFCTLYPECNLPKECDKLTPTCSSLPKAPPHPLSC